ncbi:MAG: hypothetical protein U9O96_02835 [Candidatus Thermoplasmatota archaeon]|nr:hypothetical protein [Candidatus Thermoplasmatota archaeon]
MKEYWEKFVVSLEDIRKSPSRIIALIALAVIIFSLLVAITFLTAPKKTFVVECIQCQGRDGNLVIVSGAGEQSFDVVVNVVDKDGNAVENANVKLVGSSSSSARTDPEGMAIVHVTVALDAGEQSTSLKAIVEKSGFKKYVESNFVVIARE